MKNIDRIKEMSPEELIIFMNDDKCDRCSYKDKDCGKELCSIGMKTWLNQEAELSARDISDEYHDFCHGKSCEQCKYPHGHCVELFYINNFNIVDGKITRRQK